MKKMQERGASIKQYIDAEIMSTVAKACGKQRARKHEED